MSNDIEIVIRSKDQSAQGFASLQANAKKAAAAVNGGSGSLGASVTEADKKVRGFSSTLQMAGAVAAGSLAADALQAGARRAVAAFKDTVKAANDLGESVNGVDRIFKDNADVIHNWAAKNANNFGLSQRAFNQMATPLGAMLKNGGLAMDETTSHTIKLTERASDMASVFNTDVSDALSAMQAGLRGEADPLERYGVKLSAAAVQQRALADSGKTSAAALTAQELTLARLNMIYDQTADVQGDFAATSDGMANSMRIATAQVEDAQAKMGSAFLPVFGQAAHVVGTLAGAFAALPTPVIAVTAAVVGLAAATLLLAPRIMSTKRALDEMMESGGRVQRTMVGASIAVGKAAGAFGVMAVGGQILGATLGTALNPQIDALTVNMKEFATTGKQVGEMQRLMGEDSRNLHIALDNATSSGKGFSLWVEDVIGTRGFEDSFTNNIERVNSLDSALANLVHGGSAEEAAQAFARIKAQADSQGISIDELNAAFPQYNASLQTTAASSKEAAGATRDVAKELDELDKQLKQMIDGSFSLEEAQDALADSLGDLRDQMKQQREEGVKGAGTLDRTTEAGRANADMVRGLVRQYTDLAIEQARAGGATGDLQADLESQLVGMGVSRAEAHRYAQELANVATAVRSIPPVVQITVKTNVEQALAQIRETERETRRLGSRRTGGLISGTAAAGGPRSGYTIVNEDGPEIVDLPNGSRIYPAGQSRNMMQGMGYGGGGGGRLNIEVSTAPGFAGRLGDELVRMLSFRVRTNGGSVQDYIGQDMIGASN